MNGMKSKLIQDAMDKIQAPEQLKQSTKEAVFSRMQKHSHSRLPLVFVSAVVLVISLYYGGYSWVTPVVAISVEADAEIALDVNCFDRIANAEGLNEAGKAFLDEHNLNGKTYDETISILSEYCDEYSLTIVGDEKRCQRIEEDIINHSDLDVSDIQCSQDHEEIEEAHGQGMSVGRYRAWKALEGKISEEEFSEMDMQEIHDMMGKGQHRHGRN